MKRIYGVISNAIQGLWRVPYPFEQLARARTISIVGNGPATNAEQIDAADIVVRINKAPLCGRAGQRTDILVLVNWSHPGREFAKNHHCINSLAASTAKSFWLTNNPRDVHCLQSGRDTDAPGDKSRRILRKIVKRRPYRYMPLENRLEIAELLRQYGSRSDVIPSTGAQVIHLLLKEAPQASLQLFGFSHQGWEGHCWGAEQKWINSLHAVVKS